MTPVGARLRAPPAVVFQVEVGAEPPAAEGIFLPSLKIKFSFFLSASRFREARARALALPASSMSQTELGVFVQGLAPVANGFEEGVHGFDEELLQSSATSDSCVNVKKQRGRMPPAAKGLSPLETPRENNDACWRAASRASQASLFSRSRSGG